MRNLSLVRVLLLLIFVVSFVQLDTSAQVLSQSTTMPSSSTDGKQVLTGSENFSISLADAVKLTKNFQATAPPSVPVAEYFGRDALLGVLRQPECVGLRIYYGRRDDGTPVLVLVGVNSAAQDLTIGPLMEDGGPCPPACDTSHTLGH